MTDRPGHVASALELEAARAADASLAASTGAPATASPDTALGATIQAPIPPADASAAGPAGAAATGTGTTADTVATADVSAVAVAVAAAPSALEAEARSQARGQISMPPPIRPPGPAQATPPAHPITATGWRSARSGLHRLTIGSHTCTRAALDLIGPATDRRELILGVDQAGRPIPIGQFAGGPARVALVGGYWLAHLVACRALAAGAWVVVVTNHPAVWQALVERLDGDGGRLRLVPHSPPVPIPADLPVPALVIDDGGLLADRLPAGRDTASITLITRLTAPAAVTLDRFDLVAMQRMDPTETGLAVSALALPRDSSGWLQDLGPDLLAVVRERTAEPASVHLSDDELARFGPAQR